MFSQVLSAVAESNSSDTGRRMSSSPRKASTVDVSNKPRPSMVPSTKGPTLMGLLASRRLAKQLSTRVKGRRMTGMYDSSSQLSRMKGVPTEPTYRMEPYKKFNSSKVEGIIKTVLEERLHDFPYNPKFCGNMSKVLSDDIKEKVKFLNFDRYKIVCSVLIGQSRRQGVHVSSRCAWDESLDNYASYTFKNDKIFCTAMVFATYAE